MEADDAEEEDEDDATAPLLPADMESVFRLIVILFPLPAYMTEYRADPLDTVLMMGIGGTACDLVT